MPVTYFQSSVSSVLSLAVFPVCRVYPFSLIFFFFFWLYQILAVTCGI